MTSKLHGRQIYQQDIQFCMIMLQFYKIASTLQQQLPTRIQPMNINNNNLQQSLLQFQVYKDVDIAGDHQEVNVHRQRMSMFYLICLIFGEITWILCTISSAQDHFQTAYVLIFAFIWVLLWSSIGYKKKYMYIQQYLFWVQACYHTLMYVLAKMTKNYHFLLCGCSTGIIFFIILQICASKNLVASKFFFYLYIWNVLICYNSMVKLQFIKYVDWFTMLMLDIYLFISSIFFIIILKKYSYLSKPARWQLLLLFYPWSLILVGCISGNFPQRNFHVKFAWWAIINHVVFVLLLYFIFKNRQILPTILRIGMKWKQNNWIEDNRQKLFQVSDLLLAVDDDRQQNYRQSMAGGKPLADCTLCLSQQSCFCYMNCKHVCVGKNCAKAYLEQSIKKCPFCRTQSNTLLYIQRLEGIHFAVNAKYRFKN